MLNIILQFAYLAAAILFIFGIKLMTRVKTSRRGNALSVGGMLLAVIATLIKMNWVDHLIIGWGFILGGVILGGLIGFVLSRKVEMTSMPEMVAILHTFGGVAAVLVVLSYLFDHQNLSLDLIEGMDAILGLVIGTITFSGSFVAFGKLKGFISGKPLTFPGSNWLNLALFLSILFFAYRAVLFAHLASPALIPGALLVLALAAILGALLVTPIGGADMPVVISLLNAYSGLAAASTGFVLSNIILIISGALLGASGIVLTQIMCKAMNRSLLNVLFGGFGQADSGGGSKQSSEYQNIKSTTAEEVAMIFDGASSVIIVPGYGMAVGQAQSAVKDLTNELEKRNIEVNFAIHPVAGRMPGHMNVLLAEANIPYDKLKDIDQINSQFKNTDVVYIIGANDVVNPAAIEDPQSEIYGMPILNAHEARTVINVKRSLSPGFAGIKNTLYEKPNSLMLFADAKIATEEIIKNLKEL